MDKKIVSSRFEIKILEHQDISSLLDFLIHFEGEKKDKVFWNKRLNNWWTKNPSFNQNSIRGVKLLNIKNKKIVGFIGVIPIGVRFERKETIAYCITTWRVESKYRSQSMHLLKYLLNKINCYILFNNSANELAYFLFKKLKFKPLGKESCNSYCFFMTGSRYKKSLSLRSYFNYLFLKVIYNYQKAAFKKEASKHKIVSIDKSIELYDCLWNQTKENFQIKIQRTSRIINWIKSSNNKREIVSIGKINNSRLVTSFLFIRYSYKLLCIDIWGELDASILKAVLFKAHNLYNLLIEIPCYNKIIGKELLKFKFVKKINKKDIRLGRFPRKLKNLNNDESFFTLLEGDYIM